VGLVKNLALTAIVSVGLTETESPASKIRFIGGMVFSLYHP